MFQIHKVKFGPCRYLKGTTVSTWYLLSNWRPVLFISLGSSFKWQKALCKQLPYNSTMHSVILPIDGNLRLNNVPMHVLSSTLSLTLLPFSFFELYNIYNIQHLERLWKWSEIIFCGFLPFLGHSWPSKFVYYYTNVSTVNLTMFWRM